MTDAARVAQARAGGCAALQPDGLSVIAEIKRRSPSKGALAPDDLDPALLAKAYQQGGAACLSVLTDADYFGGSSEDLARARAAVDVPVLRKDFTVGERDVCDARLMGADAVLLIAAVLSDEELARFHDLTAELGLDALVEVARRADELKRALAVGATLVGVNQRRPLHLRGRPRSSTPDGIDDAGERREGRRVGRARSCRRSPTSQRPGMTRCSSVSTWSPLSDPGASDPALLRGDA